jgi:hypothetical protein
MQSLQRLKPFTKTAMKAFASTLVRAIAWRMGSGLLKPCHLLGISADERLPAWGEKQSQSARIKGINMVQDNLKTATTTTHHAFDFAKYGLFCMSQVQYLLNRHFALSVLVKNLFSAIVLTANQS